VTKPFLDIAVAQRETQVEPHSMLDDNWRKARPQPAGDQRTKFQHPAPRRFVGNVQPTLGQEILNVSVTQREAQVQPDRVLDNRRRKPMAAIRKQGDAEILPDTRSFRTRFRDKAKESDRDCTDIPSDPECA
jgi:hypothetical protein